MPHVYQVTDNSPIPFTQNSSGSSPNLAKRQSPQDWARAKRSTTAANGIQTNGTNTNGKIKPACVSSPSKRKAVEMIDSEEDEELKPPQTPSGITRTSTPNGRRYRKKLRISNGVIYKKNSEDLLEQRKALPIWAGKPSSFFVPFRISTCLQQGGLP